MKDFPDFMKVEANHIESSQQNTKDIDGYYYIANNDTKWRSGLAIKIAYQWSIATISMNIRGDALCYKK